MNLCLFVCRRDPPPRPQQRSLTLPRFGTLRAYAIYRTGFLPLRFLVGSTCLVPPFTAPVERKPRLSKCSLCRAIPEADAQLLPPAQLSYPTFLPNFALRSWATWPRCPPTVGSRPETWQTFLGHPLDLFGIALSTLASPRHPPASRPSQLIIRI